MTDTADALVIEARIAPGIAGASYVADILAGIKSGLTVGLSPGFRVSPDPGAETIRSMGSAVLRTVNAAILEEISIVTRPAYPAAQIEARSWQPGVEPPDAGVMRHLARWRL